MSKLIEYLGKNDYYASFRIGLKRYKIPCEYIETVNGCTIIRGIPESGHIGYTTNLASVPNTVFVRLIPK